MRGIKSFLVHHKVINFIVCVICVWMLIWGYDFFRVGIMGESPMFCYEQLGEDGSARYIGAGYAFDTFDNPSTGQKEYAFYVFGNLVKTNFSN